jgi:hypothetical protein
MRAVPVIDFDRRPPFPQGGGMPYAPDPFLKIANRSQNCFPAVPSFRLSLVATARNYTSLGGEIGREIIQNS